MSQYYEIVSMSDGMPVEINRIIGLLDRKKHIKHRLYSYHLDKVLAILRRPKASTAKI